MSRKRPAPEEPVPRPLGRPFEIRACVGRSFLTWARNAPAFAVVSVVCQAPTIAFARLVQATSAPAGARVLLFGLASVLLSFLSWNLSLGAVTFGVIEDLRGRRATLGRCLGMAFRTLPSLFGISFRMSLHLLLGGGAVGALATLLAASLPLPGGAWEFANLSDPRLWFLAAVLVVVALAYLARFATSGPVAVVERLDHWRSMDRSRRLSRGRRSAVATTLFAVAVLPVSFSIWLAYFAWSSDFVSRATDPWAWLGTGFDVLVVGPLLGAAVATIYFDLRRERDGVDVEELADVFE